MKEVERLQEYQRQMGISQEALAHELGVSFQTINRWFRGKNQPSRLAYQAIKQFLEKGKNEKR